MRTKIEARDRTGLTFTTFYDGGNMSKAAEAASRLEVTVELDKSFERFIPTGGDEGHAFEGQLQRLLTELSADLALPVEISLVVRLREGEGGEGAYRVKVAGQECRLPLLSEVPADVTARGLALAVADSVFSNRELCVTAEMADAVRDELWPGQESAMEPHGFRNLLREFVRRCVRIDRLKSSTPPPAGEARNGQSAGRVFEESVADMSAAALNLFLSKAQFERASGEGESAEDESSLRGLLRMMQDGIFYELGIMLPEVSVAADEGLEENEFRLQFNDLRLPPAPGLAPDQFLVNETTEWLARLGVTGEGVPRLGGQGGMVVVRDEDGALEKCRAAGIHVRGPWDFVILSARREINNNAGSFINAGTVGFMLTRLREAYPALLDAVARRFDAVDLTRIFRELLDEEISVRNSRTLLEGLLNNAGPTDLDLSNSIAFFADTANLSPVAGGAMTPPHYADFLRTTLKPYISHKYTRGLSSLPVYLLAPELESEIRRAEPFNADTHRRLLNSVRKEIMNLPDPANPPVILTTIEVRKRVRELIEKEFPQLAVLSYQELKADLNIQSVGRILWN